jgi:DNA-binding NtrC family response regulator
MSFETVIDTRSVDDEETARLTTEAVLGDDFDVFVAGSGEEALSKMRRMPIEVVVTDLVMPGMNGLELLARLKEQYDSVHAVLVTGHRDYLSSRASACDVSFDLLLKPYNPSELIQIVKRAIEVRRLRRALSALSSRNPRLSKDGHS